jgi:hypothetical protein
MSRGDLPMGNILSQMHPLIILSYIDVWLQWRKVTVHLLRVLDPDGPDANPDNNTGRGSPWAWENKPNANKCDAQVQAGHMAA